LIPIKKSKHPILGGLGKRPEKSGNGCFISKMSSPEDGQRELVDEGDHVSDNLPSIHSPQTARGGVQKVDFTRNFVVSVM
jgi:hypothetical protein